MDLPAQAALADAGRPEDEQAAPGGDRQAGQLRRLGRQDQAGEGRDQVLGLPRRRVREFSAQHGRIRLQAHGRRADVAVTSSNRTPCSRPRCVIQ
jgi:hypothetical protein